MDASKEINHLLDGFASLPEQSLARLDEAKEAGVKVVGVYCIFAPLEIIRAAGALPVGLCGKRQEPIAAAEAELPSNLCPLVKSSYGYALTGTCPFFMASDVVLGETTCDGKKKMYEAMERIKPVHLMHLPHTAGLPHALDYWRAEIERLKAFLQELTGQEITPEALRHEIDLQNRVRRLVVELHRVNAASPRPAISGGRMLPILEAKNSWPDLEDFAQRLEALIAAVEAYNAAGLGAGPRPPRVLLTGTPIGKGSDKVLRLIEEAGGLVIAMENCTGLKGAWTQVDQDAGDPLDALARRHLALPCSCMTPNQGRYDLLEELIPLYQVDGVVDLSWHACHTYIIEATPLGRHLEDKLSLPVMRLTTDYSESDVETLRTRVEAFLEMLS
ncbi:MAG: 2-hydroxyacyl-CoA dehydratase family protein [Desulfarculaceae bacterium]|nr:2-hydroxyacyl-CoA dehydratase family protein [Desulfarculaceae bacterium]MCF8071518.1 2-hydroxyacyl-CoA dehydratase family protein [Desulfarculaceae bacterium]MCF8102333.1 2-hydroxyacyl-CoA dehydratase family protein [Desulfarculaceae bacterium]MCF8114797.1 2-hydroxyacyl-CoA dehydratase family protein [Desulfarculaceae bacterium]